MKTSVVVVGCGIVGLTSAIRLQEQGFQVTIVSKERYQESLSHKVGAIWFPFEVHPLEKANQWASVSYQMYLEQVSKAPGVSFIPFMVASTPTSDTSWISHLPSNTVGKAAPDELPQGMDMAYVAQVPLAEPGLYLPYLFETFLNNGGVYKTQAVKSLEEMSHLGDWVINCTGLGAKKICQDEHLRPMRGQILRCQKIEVMSCVNSTQPGKLSYIINRSTDSIVGGTDYLDDDNEQIDDNDTQMILNRLKTSGYSQETPEILEVLVGLRPLRREVRFEFDRVYPNIFHNYGHGGAGFTVAWGCAVELVGVLRC